MGPDRLCSTYQFTQVGDSYTANITNLGFDAIARDPNTNSNIIFTVLIPNLCVGVPSAWTTEAGIGREFAAAYNFALAELFTLLNTIEPDVSVTSEWAAGTLADLIALNINALFLDEFLSVGGSAAAVPTYCPGVPITDAQWCD